jgi:branched-chain amino acid transport system permease protein
LTQLGATTRVEPLNRGKAIFNSLMPLIGALLVAVAMEMTGAYAGDYPKRIMLDCGVAMIAAISLTIVNGFTGQFSIGHAAFMAIGGYTSGFITYYFLLKTTYPGSATGSLFGSTQWLLAIACVAGGLASAIAGWVVGLPSLRLKGDYLAIVTLGFGEIVRVLLQQTPKQIYSTEDFQTQSIWSVLWPPAVGGASGFEGLPKVSNLFWVYLFASVTAIFTYRLKTSSYGRAMLSIREDEIAAEAMGINVTRLKVRAFMLAAFFAGVAGALYAHEPGNQLQPVDAGFSRSFDIVMMVVLGGLGSISGSALAAILITVLNAYLTKWGQFRMPIFALALILVMIFRPKGLFGVHEAWDYFRFRKRAAAT